MRSPLPLAIAAILGGSFIAIIDDFQIGAMKGELAASLTGERAKSICSSDRAVLLADAQTIRTERLVLGQVPQDMHGGAFDQAMLAADASERANAEVSAELEKVCAPLIGASK